ncbi:ImmA/IrrE family metallo-endopeptidase [Pararhodospirillum photometricum]|uniref:IrrE N-terminal-like domain-containing protein n=1 Tax=Pararhodospirillum photometricum DSM 122 TaxID=1150469 RepID=H6SIS0_PARPM|nr:ImmA/IrrE family metallo-endopeptidase [Pararhodospirillum photometricum]CCG06697.1 Putative uncharacterized protein [Pararhodospirillum photometricum DSM 122]
MTSLDFHVEPERLTEGAAEERATFGLLKIMAHGRSLTEGFDAYLDGSREGPLVSAYPLAEWLVWNWWRLKGEPPPSRPSRSWRFAHCLSTIGEGYVWPNLTIYSDGFRVVLDSQRSGNNQAVFRYFGARPVLAAWTDLEEAMERFAGDVLSRLEAAQIRASNLHALWDDLQAERADPELRRYRELEARLGFDPGEADEAMLQARLAEARLLGEEAMGELASLAAHNSSDVSRMMAAADLREMAKNDGQAMAACPETALADDLRWGMVPAHEIGVRVARQVRASFANRQISDQALADLAGTSSAILKEKQVRGPLSFALVDEGGQALAVLSGKRTDNRRFELARLIGDRLMRPRGALFPATAARSYRQKAQRAFAAEFLAPIEAVTDMASNDFSEERQQEIAEYFRVSFKVINSLLKNNHVIDRDFDDFQEIA